MNRIFYILGVLLIVYASIFYDVMYFRAFLVVLILLPFILYGIVRYQKEHLTVTLRLNTPAVNKRKPFTVQVIADNHSKIPVSRLDIQLSLANEFAPEAGKVKLHGMADSESVTYINYTVTSEFCGRLSVQSDSLRIYDIFGITFCRLPKTESLSVIVMPGIHNMDIQVSASTGSYPAGSDEFDPHMSGDDTSEILGFREYQGGDRPNQIHWKLSMKSEDFMVKDFSHPIEYSAVLLLNFASKGTNMPHVGRIDSFIETAASLSNSMLALSCYHYVCWYSPKENALIRQSIKNEDDLADMLVQLFFAKPYEETFDLADLYQNTYDSDTQSSRLILDMNLKLQKNNDDIIQFQPNHLHKSLMAASIVV